MKTILINGRFVTQRTTGIQRYAWEMVRALARSHQDRYRFILGIPGGMHIPDIGVEVVADDGVKVGGGSGSWRGPLWQQWRLPRLMELTGADLLWSPCNLGPLSVSRQVVTIHDASMFAGPEWFSWSFRTYYRWMLPLLARSVRHIVTDSHFSKDELVRYGIADAARISVVYGGVSPEFQPSPSRRPAQPYVLTLGSRDPRKNVVTLLDAWSRMTPDQKQGCHLVVTGGDSGSFASERLGRLPADVRFTGFLPDADLPALYAGAQAFVFPSLYEGFGFPPLEAMACGTPVLAAKIPCLEEVCGDAAAYASPKDPEALAAAIAALIADDTRRQALRQNGIRRVADYNWDASAAALVSVFDGLYGTAPVAAPVTEAVLR